jgi:probable blue pigment (indigoidine) exporter
MIAVIMLYAISASTFMVSKLLLMYSSPLFLSGLRTLFAGLIFLLYLKSCSKIGSYKKYIVPCLAIGFFSFYISNTLKFFALHSLTSERAALISISEPFFALFFAYFLCGETMTLRRWLGLIVCIFGAGIGIVSGFNLSLSFSLPEFILLVSVISSSFGALLMRKFVRLHNYSATVINCMSMGTAGVFALSTSFVIEDPLATIAVAPVLFFFSLLAVMVLVSNIFAYSLYGKLVKQYSAVLISSASLLRPFFVALYGGTINAQIVCSLVVISLGLIILYREEKWLGEISSPPSHAEGGCEKVA